MVHYGDDSSKEVGRSILKFHLSMGMMSVVYKQIRLALQKSSLGFTREKRGGLGSDEINI